jgi:general secretion pathway protein M
MNKIVAFKESIQLKLEPHLTPLQGKVLDRWDELNNRDQLIVMALGVFISITLFLLLIYSPLVKYRDQQQVVYENKAELLSWMRSVAPQLKGQGVSGLNSLSAQSMMNDVNQRAAAFQLKLDRVQPEGANKLRVWIQDGSFDAIMRWLAELQNESGIVASSVSLDSEKKIGIVSAKVVLQGG